MHIAGLRPLYTEPAAVPQAVLDAERAVLAAAAGTSGKAAAVVDTMVAGRLKKWYQEVRLGPGWNITRILSLRCSLCIWAPD
jgi:elongation factor Ts